MMTQEEYMEVLAFKRQGLSNKEIGDALGYHPATISKWLKDGGPPPARKMDPAERVIDDRWAARIRELLRPPADKLLATSVFEIIRAEGFDGSYPSVVRHLRELRGPRFRAAPAVSMPIETAPGEEAQFDFSDCSGWTERWGLGEVWCFGVILCWSRWRRWWFTTSIDVEAGTVTVVDQLIERRGVLDVGPPKTAAGRRTVSIPPHILQALENHLREHVGDDPDDLVFTSSWRSPLRRGTFNHRASGPACRAVGLTGFRFHDLRHTGNTLPRQGPAPGS